AEAVELANRIASEHVELMLDDPRALQPKIRNAGAIFLGHHTPEAIGDYVGGSNHVLPTARSARYASGLGVLDFMKRTSILGCDPASLAELAPAAGQVEGALRAPRLDRRQLHRARRPQPGHLRADRRALSVADPVPAPDPRLFPHP